MIKILQVGLGPLGINISKHIQAKSSMQTIAAVDINSELTGKDLGQLVFGVDNNVLIRESIADLNNIDEVDVVVLTTSSSLASIAHQLDTILDYSIPVVSTCEELTYPWDTDKLLADKINKKALEKNVAVVSTGVNPGFLMDTLPSVLTGVCQSVDRVEVNRFQDAQTRRVPFQKKIGAGLSLGAFEEKKKAGTLRHVGLTESIYFIASAVGWDIDYTEDIISPVIATEEIHTESMNILKGDAMGVRQVGIGSYRGKEKIKLVFEAAVGSGTSYDEVRISGNPNIHSKIEGGVHGDVATCSIVLNTIPSVLKSTPGLKTMKDISIVSFVQ